MHSEKDEQYWRANLRVLAVLLSIWAVVSFGGGVIFVEELNAFSLGGYPLGLWISQQGALFIYVALIFIYHAWMTRLERAFSAGEEPEPPGENDPDVGAKS